LKEKKKIITIGFYLKKEAELKGQLFWLITKLLKL